jgi:hypothetical protein
MWMYTSIEKVSMVLSVGRFGFYSLAKISFPLEVNHFVCIRVEKLSLFLCNCSPYI